MMRLLAKYAAVVTEDAALAKYAAVVTEDAALAASSPSRRRQGGCVS
jgi:phosphohistidine swiveling domain-containing protein